MGTPSRSTATTVYDVFLRGFPLILNKVKSYAGEKQLLKPSRVWQEGAEYAAIGDTFYQEPVGPPNECAMKGVAKKSERFFHPVISPFPPQNVASARDKDISSEIQ